MKGGFYYYITDVFYSFEKKVEHYRVISNNNKVTVDEEEYFENLVKLVEVNIAVIALQCHSLVCCSIIRKKLMGYVQDCALLLTRRENMMCVLTLRHLKKVSVWHGDLFGPLGRLFTAGWAIQRRDITLGQLLGKGEFGGEYSFEQTCTADDS